MLHILKWDVPIDDQAHEIGGGQVILVAQQSNPSLRTVQVWTLEGIRYPEPPRNVIVVGTGQEFSPALRPIGSTISVDGQFVWHVLSELF